MAANTTAFIENITAFFNELLPTTYEEAPAKGAFPYSVVSGINITDLAPGDLTFFYLDIYIDEKKPGAAVELEELCDALRNKLTGAVLYVPGVFGAHLEFENQNGISEADYDLSHRRLSVSARIFYN